MNTMGSFVVEYPLGIEDKRMKPMMAAFTHMMFNSFAHYHLIEKVMITWERVFVVAEGHVKEFALHNEQLFYVTSHKKEGFQPNAI